MAAPRRSANGKWIIQIQIDGKRRAKSFDSKSAADLWAAKQLVTPEKQASTLTLGDVCSRWYERYADTRKKAQWEKNRIAFYASDPLMAVKAKDLTPGHVAEWRDRRLKEIKPGTLLRDWNFFSGIVTVAIKEMGLMTENAFRKVRRPDEPPPRDRLPTPDEMARLEHCAAGRPSFERAWRCFQFACETGMSIGEIAALTWDQIDGRIASLPPFKTRPARRVPLSKKAVALLGEPFEGKIFHSETSTVDANWRKLTKMAAVTGLTFHDSRHYAATQLAKKLTALELAKMLGHRDLKMLLHVYYSDDAESLLGKLD